MNIELDFQNEIFILKHNDSYNIGFRFLYQNSNLNILIILIIIR